VRQRRRLRRALRADAARRAPRRQRRRAHGRRAARRLRARPRPVGALPRPRLRAARRRAARAAGRDGQRRSPRAAAAARLRPQPGRRHPRGAVRPGAQRYWEGERFESLLAEPVWQGDGAARGALNRPPPRACRSTRSARSSRASTCCAPACPGPTLRHAAGHAVVPGLRPRRHHALGTDGLHVVAQRLSDGRPVPGLRVTLLARSNRVLAEAISDDQGHVRFAAALTRGTGAAAPVMVLVEGEDDMAVLSLDEPSSTSPTAASPGAAAPGPIDLFLTTDRGAYRPGETIHVTALARDHQARAITGLPLSARLLRPDGVEYARVSPSTSARAGTCSRCRSAPTCRAASGAWRCGPTPDAPALASRTVLVEDFVPERIDVEIRSATTARSTASRPEPAARGAPRLRPAGGGAAALGQRARRHHRRARGLARLPLRPLRRARRRAARSRSRRGSSPTPTGGSRPPLPLDRLALDARPYLLDRARDDRRRLLAPRRARPHARAAPHRAGGRHPPRLRRRPPRERRGHLRPGAGRPGRRRMPGDLRWQVDRVETRYQWFSLDGRWFWEPVSDRQRVAEGVVASRTARPASPCRSRGAARAARHPRGRRLRQRLVAFSPAGTPPTRRARRPTCSSCRSTRPSTRPATWRGCASSPRAPAWRS
jgi:alpha-2-macroglobulin